MAIGLVGRKIGMTRVFKETGESVPVSVVMITDNRITQIRTMEKDNYSAIQVKEGFQKPSRIIKPLAGQYAKAGVEAGRGLWEFRLEKN